MKRLRHAGFSLVELMIAILLASITAVVVLQVLTSYQARSNTVAGRNDAEISVATGLYAVEKEIRMAGAGLTTASGTFCPKGVNIAWNNTVVSNAATLMPVRIIDGGAGPDAIEIIRSDSDFGAAPSRLIGNMASATAALSVDGNAGLTNGDLMMLGAKDGLKICTLTQLTADPTSLAPGWSLTHAPGTGNYNPADPAVTFTTAVQYEAVDMVMNMGRYGVRRFGIVCNAGALPIATNTCDLAWWNSLDPTAPTLATVNSLTPQIIELQAQYGISATVASKTVNQWVDATGAWSAPSMADQQRIKAIRISIVARGAREGQALPPTSVLLWQDDPLDPATARTRAFSAGEQRFRYQALTVVIPLINTIWTGA
jgi:type IV pilus assembly protein PilW